MSINLTNLENRLVMQADQKTFDTKIEFKSRIADIEAIAANGKVEDFLSSVLPIGRCMMMCILACREIDVSLGVALEAAMKEMNLKT